MYIVHNMHTCLICFPTIRPVQAAAIQSAAMCTKATGEEEVEGCYYYLWSWAFVASSKAIVHIRSSIADNERRAAFFLGCLRQGHSDSAEFTTAAVEKTHREGHQATSFATNELRRRRSKAFPLKKTSCCQERMWGDLLLLSLKQGGTPLLTHSQTFFTMY